MNIFNRWKYLPAALGMMILFFLLTGLFDILIAVFYSRFYTTAAFVVTFGVGGIFAAVLTYTNGIAMAPKKDEITRWSILVLIWITALVFIFPMSMIEEGEYKAACISYGITLGLTSFLFVKEKLDQPSNA